MKYNYRHQIQNGFRINHNDDDMEDEEESIFHGGEADESDNDENSQQTKTPYLDNFTTDITALAREDVLDPVVGRTQEIERLSQILSRRKKNNPILIGEPGVGKSAIVEGLAQRINAHTISHNLEGKRILNLDMAAIVAGTKYRGQFEERIQNLLKELKSHPEVVLFIDEIHTIIGAGSAPGSMDAANMLKPALARGEIQCIGATTLDEYRKSIEKDGALERRFQKIIVPEPSQEETLQILQNLKARYEDHHVVTYTDKALEQCVKLANRYMTDRSFPDKAIDVMDEAGSRAHICLVEVPEHIIRLEKEYQDLLDKKNQSVKNQNFELAANYRDESVKVQRQLKQAKAEWETKTTQNRVAITEENIAEVVGMITGIPVNKIAENESARLKGMLQELSGKVIGQQTAVEKVVKAIQRGRMGLKDPNRPIGTFLFLGPTGVGKTLLAKQLAEFMFGSAEALIRIDMSEYMEKFNVSRLVGAPPGYVGYEEGGQLTEKVRRRPYSIVLLDEVEKAHGDVFNLLLQAMDEGRLTDSNGRQVDFRNTVIIMTSNVGSRQLTEFGHSVGFTGSSQLSTAQSDSIVQKALRKQFTPEFLNRLDEIITFSSLNEEAIHQIINLELAKLEKRVQELGFTLQVNTEAIQFLAKKGYDPQMGARPLRRSIQTYVEDSLSELLMNEQPALGSTLVVSHEDNADKLALNMTSMTEPLPEGTPVVLEMVDF